MPWMPILSQNTHFRKYAAHLLLLLLLVAAGSFAWAQQSGGQSQASFTVDSLALSPGGVLKLSGHGFQPGETLLIALTGPQGNVQLDQEQASPEGDFTLQARLQAMGKWRLEVQRGSQQGSARKALEVEVKAGATPTAPKTAVFGPAAPAPKTAGQAAPSPSANASGGDGAQSAQPPVTNTPSSPSGPIKVTLQNGALVATQGGQPLWKLGFPEGSGSTGDLLETQGRLYLTHGTSVLKIDKVSGVELRRWLVSGPISGLAQDGDAIAISVTLPGTGERFTLTGGKLQPTARFSVTPAVFGWLKQEADVTDPLARLKQDPTNPYLALDLGVKRLKSDPAAAQRFFQQALTSARTFYDLAALSQTFYAHGQTDLAKRAFAAAMKDFAARGYTPALLTDPALEKAYNFPLEPLQTALQKSDVTAASFWAERLWLAAPNVPGAQQALQNYAALLSRQGQKAQAKTWRARLAGDNSVAGSANSLLSSLARSGWYAALAVLIAIVALYLTLVFKYWIPQSRTRGQARGGGGAAHLLAIRCFTFTEKLVLAAMFVAVFALGALALWGAQRTPLNAALGSGTLANTVAQDYLASTTLNGLEGDFIRGYASQTAGNSTAAVQAYRQAGSYAPALNNLGVLTDNEQDYQRALQLSPGLAAAKYNLGDVGALPFQQTYLPGQPALAAPTPEDFHAALGGAWENALSGAFSNPWGAFRRSWPAGLSLTLWTVIQVLFLLAAVTSILWLLVPRPRRARNAPRTVFYHILAVLIPGTGEADEVWGFLLLIPWALVGLDTVAGLLGWRSPLTLTMTQDIVLLIVIYAINLAAFIVELDSYGRRMRERREQEQARLVGTHS